VTHVLGFEDVPRGLRGDLSIIDGYLHFQRDGIASVQVPIASIQNVYVGEQDKQVGGVPMMLGKAAVPFGGGRMVSLFSHKKYDTIAIDYLDSRGGSHGAVFRLARGEGDVLKDALQESPTTAPAYPTVAGTTAQKSVSSERWSVQVERVDSEGTALDPCFSNAIYENLLSELKKSRQFNGVFRNGDRNAKDASALLVLKTRVEKYSPGSETRRAVTTVAGATKLTVHIQLVTADGRVVVDRAVAGNVRFFGDNLKATSKVASNTAKLLKRTSLESPAAGSPMTANAKPLR
jgi:hypothetical protein